MRLAPLPARRLAGRLLARSLLALGLAAGSASAQAPADVRLALVIGNADYPGGGKLLNPVRDAAAMAATLRRLGFTVVEVHNASRTAMLAAIASLRERLHGKRGVGMLYYAGHGVQVQFRNYMLPVEAQLPDGGSLATAAVDMGAVIAAFQEAGNRLNIVVLDACRDNPFGQATGTRGLAPLDAPSGTFLAYATAPGHVAEDGDAASGNGLYTSHLVRELARPAARIEDVFKRVRMGVRQASAGRQVPWESTSLEEDFFFDPTASARPRPKPGSREDDALFEAEKAAWERIRQSARPEDFYAYLQLFPNGRFSEQAHFRLNQRERPQAVPVVAHGEYLGPRFRPGDRFEIARRDGYSRSIVARASEVVLAVEEARVTFATGASVERDAMGARISDQFATYDPPLVELPAEYKVGKTWEGRASVNSPWPATGYLSYRSRITGREKVTVGAREYDAYVIETSGSVRLNSYAGAVKHKTWAVPELGVPLKQNFEWNISGSPALTRREITELVGVSAPR